MSPLLLSHEGYSVRLAEGAEDVEAAQGLRYRAFVDQAGQGRDADRFDREFDHVLVLRGDVLVATFRFRLFASGRDATAGYSTQFYDLTPLERFAGPVLEMGRFCMSPGDRDPDILRLTWGGMARLVDRSDVSLLFGCSSFPGTDPTPFADSFAFLRARHLAPSVIRVGKKAKEAVAFPTHEPDPIEAQRRMPPLLRTYLMMGGWVSDHAVVDRALVTLHVFTGVEIAKVPANRARALRALAGD
ncbi:GNAT family N-acetyltransferase [Maritimibacter dapengensis]|uniref:GNAT family N-acetyltransferase n=1 Tax=Maritimibacter dapengensis TaxID=2836868 RepID=A0ABS6T308_9RHOB|nr:GNAT family N-acetyltransferase [Maritimibacter dapengensis]MBV7379648.1 GNAT family N-acetyltransferase [Maritimibacter dapengensis]